MPARADSRTVYDTWHAVNHGMRVGAWIKRWPRWGRCGAVLQQDSAPWLSMPFLRCTEERDYVVRIAESLPNM